MLAMGVVLALLWGACSSEEPAPPAQPAAALPAAPAPTPAAFEPVPPPTPLAAAPAAPSLSPMLSSTPVPPTPIPTEEATAPAAIAVFSPASCRFRAPSGQSVDCGYLRVPEDRGQPDGPNIRLHVAIFRTQSESPAPDPIVLLSGGPGENALELVELTFDRIIAPFLVNRDFIMFDQRGAGLSEPALDCPEVIDLTYSVLNQDLSVEESLALRTAAVSACRDRLVGEGVNLAAYTSAENAADVRDLRLALDYEDWNLLGISYGTRLALTTMREYPEGIRSVILDSTVPLQVDFYASIPGNTDRAFSVLFDGCAADASCNEAYPGLESAYFALVDRLNDSPVMLDIPNLITGDRFDSLLDGDGLISFLFQSLYSTEILPLLPKIIYDAREGRFDTVALIQGSLLAQIDFFSIGMLYSVRCGEEVRFSTPERFASAAEDHPRLRGFLDRLPIFTICQSWGAREADPIENEAVESNIQTLVLAGEYDPVTPPEWGRIAAETLSNSFYFEFPGIGHGASVSGDCPLNIALAFLDDPMLEPDPSCIGSLGGPAFVVPEAEITLTPFTDDQFGFSGLVPDGWIEGAPGVHSRSELGIVSMVQQALPGVGTGQLLQILAAEMGLGEAPEVASVRESSFLTWSLYELESEGLSMDVALAQDETGVTYFIVLQSTCGERQLYYNEVFVPAVDALRSTSE